MKLPEKPPKWQEVLSSIKNHRFGDRELTLILSRANKEYLYWDDFKHKPMPEWISPQEAWAYLKLMREADRKTVYFSNAVSFSYQVSSDALEKLHFIDKNAGGMILAGDRTVIGQEERGRYIMRSLADEAIASSQIEGAVTTRAVAKEMIHKGRPPKDYGERMIFNNYNTILKIKDMLDKPLSIELLNALHAEISHGTLDDPSWEGRLRTEQNWIHDPSNQTVLYTPPPFEIVENAMQRLCDFANAEGPETEFVHPVIKGIILHFWLAWIHPYMDGNGRLTRALFYWYMLKHGYWLFEFLSISSAIFKRRTQYYYSFLHAEADENDMTYFIRFNLGAIQETVDNLREYIGHKEREKRNTVEFLKRYPTLNHRQRALLASALENPDEVFDFATHSRVHGIVYQSARSDIMGLQSLGLLIMRKSGNKMLFYPADGLREKLS